MLCFTVTGALLMWFLADTMHCQEERMADTVVKLKQLLPPDKYKAVIFNYTARFFAPNTASRPDDQSTWFFLQKEKVKKFKYLFGSDFSLEYNAFDFLDDSSDGETHEGVKFVNVVQREEMINFKKAEKTFLSSRPKSVQGFDVGTAKTDPLAVNLPHLKNMLTRILTFPRNHRFDRVTATPLKEAIASYIWRKFGMLGFLTGVQTFEPRQFLKMHPGGVPTGTNLLGILPGSSWGTSSDRVVVVGAHWDTVQKTGGFNDNGSGVGVMLELARAFSQAKCRNKNTLIFVAFDLEEFGSQGSMMFVQDFLVPMVLRAKWKPQFGGALVLDSVMNYNNTRGSQDVLDDWHNQVKDAAEAIERNHNKGDFMAVFSRNKADSHLVSEFQRHWNNNKDSKENKDYKFRLRQFKIKDLDNNLRIKKLADNVNFLRSDHARFWYGNNVDFFVSLPALMITDTGPFRGVMRDCYHALCDIYDPKNSSWVDWNFLSKATQTLIDTTVSLTDSVCKSRRKFSHLKSSKQTKNKQSYFFFKKQFGQSFPMPSFTTTTQIPSRSTPSSTTSLITTTTTVKSTTNSSKTTPKIESSSKVNNHKRMNSKTSSTFPNGKGEGTKLLAFTGSLPVPGIKDQNFKVSHHTQGIKNTLDKTKVKQTQSNSKLPSKNTRPKQPREPINYVFSSGYTEPKVLPQVQYYHRPLPQPSLVSLLQTHNLPNPALYPSSLAPPPGIISPRFQYSVPNLFYGNRHNPYFTWVSLPSLPNKQYIPLQVGLTGLRTMKKLHK